MRAGSYSSSPKLRSHQRLAAGQRHGFRQNPSLEKTEVNIAAAEYEPRPLAAYFLLLLQGGGERGSGGTLSQIVRVGPVGADGGGHLSVCDLDNARGAFAYDCERIGVGNARGDSVGHRAAGGGGHNSAGCERKRIGRRRRRLHPDNFGFEAEQVTRHDATADPEPCPTAT